MTETTSPRPEAPAHVVSAQNVCIRCGRADPATSSEPCIPVPEVHLLDGPLEIVPSEGAEVGAMLVSARDHSRLVAVVRPSGGHFDPDAAFRALDDHRSRAETVLQWVAESLAGDPGVVADEEEGLRPWFPMIAAYGAVAIVVLVIPGFAAVAVARWAYLAFMVLVVIGGTLTSGVGGCLVSGVFALFLLLLAGLAKSWGIVPEFSRFVLFAIGACISTVVLNPFRGKIPPRDGVPVGPTEYVMREGEAVRHEPGLCLVGEKLALAVVIRCLDANGILVRQVLLPVANATRADADEVARMALAPDRRSAQRRATAEAAEKAAAEAAAEAAVEAALEAEAARQRIAELERNRRSLPE